MKTYGIPETQQIVSIVVDDEGNPRFDTLRPVDAGEDWQPPTLFPLVKLPKPDHDTWSQTCEPKLVWFDDRVERDWEVVTKPDSLPAFFDWLSNQRWQKETGGITVGEQPISTHRDEAAHWLARYSDATRWLLEDATARAINPDGIYPYKPKHGEPVYLSATQVVRAYLCQAWYVNACFAVEKAAADAVKGGAAIGDVVASIQWPQTSFDWEPS
jgi:hypothetical protein